MPLKLTVGLSKKVGLPNYGSLGATCGLEIELASSALHADPEGFGRQVRDAFAACARAVQEELDRHRPPPSVPSPNNHPDPDRPDGPAHHREGASGPRHRPATGSQVRALRAISGRRGVDLVGLVGDRFGIERPEELTVTEASRLIDELRAPAEVPA